jgi:hypothetical protein
VNRQIVSTHEGLRRATRPFALKLRTDCQLLHDGFTTFFDQFPARAKEHRYFADRIVGCELFFRDPAKSDLPLLFHLGDLAMFGRTDDLRDLWDIELAREDDVVGWVPRAGVPRRSRFTHYSTMQSRYVEEQHVWTSFLRKRGAAFSLRFPWEFTRELAEASELSLINNFVVVGAEEFGIHLPARLHSPQLSPDGVYRHEDWLKLYALYCADGEKAIGRADRLATLERVHRRRYIKYYAWRFLEAQHYMINAGLRTAARVRQLFRRPAP